MRSVEWGIRDAKPCIPTRETGKSAIRNPNFPIERMTSRLRIDWFMFAIATGLAVFGTMMVYSASAMIAHRETGGASQFTYFYKQSAFTIVGLAAMFIASRIDYRRYQAAWFVYGSLGFTVLCLMAVFAF